MVFIWSKAPRLLAKVEYEDVAACTLNCGLQVQHHLGAVPLLVAHGVLTKVERGSVRGRGVVSIGASGNEYRINPASKWAQNVETFCRWSNVVARFRPTPKSMRTWIRLAAKINEGVKKHCETEDIIYFPLAGYHSDWTIRLHLLARRSVTQWYDFFCLHLKCSSSASP